MSASELAKARLASSVAPTWAEPAPNRAAPAATARDAAGRPTGAAHTRPRWQALGRSTKGKLGRGRAPEAADGWVHVQASNIAPVEVLYLLLSLARPAENCCRSERACTADSC